VVIREQKWFHSKCSIGLLLALNKALSNRFSTIQEHYGQTDSFTIAITDFDASRYRAIAIGREIVESLMITALCISLFRKKQLSKLQLNALSAEIMGRGHFALLARPESWRGMSPVLPLLLTHQKALKHTYRRLVFQKFPWEDPRTPALRVREGTTGEGRVDRGGQAREGIGSADVYARYAKT
jgi:hypothetical protein